MTQVLDRVDFAIDMHIMRLAATAIDVRGRLDCSQFDRAPSLTRALDALEEVIREMGWDDESCTASASRRGDLVK